MKIYKSIDKYNESKSSVVTIGTFDGIHKGHQKIFNKVINVSKQSNLSSVVLTFFPHPRIILNKYNDIKMIDTLDEKIEHLEKIGIDNLIIHPFDKKFSLLSADQFIKEYLVEKLKLKHIIIGYDHRSGKVIKGDGLGKQIDYPTANLLIEEDYKIIPKDGVYYIRTRIDNKLYNGMMNIGHRPTIGNKAKSIEVNLFNFDRNIYDIIISVDVVLKIRDEKKFSSINALKAQLAKDEEHCLKLINK